MTKEIKPRKKALREKLKKTQEKIEKTGKLGGQEHGSVLKFKQDQADPVTYDIKMLEKFMDETFHDVDNSDDCNVLVWGTTRGIPGYPSTEKTLFDTLKRSKKPRALYFGTSTCRKDPHDGVPYNRKNLFYKLHVVVLDDIGTKVPIDSLPAVLTDPTYIIETSESNFQYGYVLDKAIATREHAEALIQLVYESGYSDGGGKMATKLVRLPDGINGKSGIKYGFQVKLITGDGPLWTPDELLTAIDVGVTWEDVKKDAEEVIRRRVRASSGTSPWSPIKPQAEALNGVTDPVLEWLYENDYVKQETDDWITITCPWGQGHSEGDGTAGYSPVGRGDGYENRRAFHCFHEHCKDNHTAAFLQYVAANGGPEASHTDEAARLVARWVYDSSQDVAWEIQALPRARNIAMNAFKNTFPRSVRIYKHDGKAVAVKEAALWLCAPNRVTVQGQIFDPTTSARIVSCGKDLMINTFYTPEWGEGAYDEEDVKTFKQFLRYLLPNKKDRKYFLDWFAAKVQNMSFRGAAILMIAKQQGTGRNTLADMLATLIGEENRENVAFDTLIKPSQYNEWMEAPLIVTSETKDLGDVRLFYAAYERLKAHIDLRPSLERINPKYGRQRRNMVYSSYLMFSNHDNALAVAGNDRRINVMLNAIVPADISYFRMLDAWLAVKDKTGKPKWARSIWRWLQQREPDYDMLLAPAPETAAKKDMIMATKSLFTIAVETAVLASGSDFVVLYKVKELLKRFATRLELHMVPNVDAQLRAIISHLSEPITAGSQIKVDGKVIRPRITHKALIKEGYVLKYTMEPLSTTERAEIRTSLEDIDMEALAAKITEALDLKES